MQKPTETDFDQGGNEDVNLEAVGRREAQPEPGRESAVGALADVYD